MPYTILAEWSLAGWMNGWMADSLVDHHCVCMYYVWYGMPGTLCVCVGAHVLVPMIVLNWLDH